MSNVMTDDQLSPTVTVMAADCHLELNCPAVKNIIIDFVKVCQLNEVGEIPIRYLFTWLTVVRPKKACTNLRQLNLNETGATLSGTYMIHSYDFGM